MTLHYNHKQKLKIRHFTLCSWPDSCVKTWGWWV